MSGKLDEKYGYEILVGVSHHLVTLSVSIIGGLFALIRGTGGTYKDTWIAEWAMWAAGLAVLFSLILQLTISSQALRERQWLRLPHAVPFFFAWLPFIASITLSAWFLSSNI